MKNQLKLQIAGGMYSVVDVLEAFANKVPTAVTVGSDINLKDASFHSTENNLLVGEVVVESDKDIDKERILRELADQFVGIGFRFDEAEVTK